MPYKDPEKKRQKQREYSKQHYQKNRDYILKRAGTQRRKGRDLWEKFKMTLQCAVCGFSHPAALDFHHPPNTKTHNVHTLIAAGRYAEAYRETEKCIVLCSNCHRIHHWKEAKDRRRARKKKGAEAP